MPKKSIRGQILARRKQLSFETCLSRSLKIQQRLLETEEFAKACSLAIYSPILNEVSTEYVFRVAKRMGKKVAYPRVREDRLEFVEVAECKDLRTGTFGVLEPVGSTLMPLSTIDLVVVPGVAFDMAGHRLGYGKGFYDRVLHECGQRGLLIGLCFEFQTVSSLPVESHDIRMDMLITEDRTLRFDNLLF